MPLDSPTSNRSFPRSRIILMCVVIIFFSEIATFEILMVLPALPHMAADLRTPDIAWVASIVTLSGAVVLPLAGKFADRYGKKRVILTIGLIFVAGSIICATTQSFPVMLLGRALQGMMAGVVALSYGLVRDIIPRTYVPLALGAVVTGIGMGGIAGPFLAGWLVDGYGYRSVFWFMAIYIGVLLPLYAVLVAESPVRVRVAIDYPGAALLGLGAGLVLLGVGEGGSWGWGSGTTLGVLAMGAVLLAAFVVRQLRARTPLLDLRILTGPRFGLTVLAVGSVSYMMNAHAIITPTMLETPRLPGNSYGAGLSVLDYAIWTFPMGVVGMGAGPLGGWLAKRIGARQVLLASGGSFLVALFLASRLFTLQWEIGVMSLFMGFAVGFLHSANANLLQDALPARLGGVGNSVAGVMALLAGTTATTVSGAIMARHVTTADPTSHAVVHTDAAFTHAYLYAMCVGLIGVLIALFMKHGRRPAQGGLVETADALPAGRPADSGATDPVT